MKIFFIVNDPPYGTESCFNAHRLVLAISKDAEKPENSVFCLPMRWSAPKRDERRRTASTAWYERYRVPNAAPPIDARYS